MSISACFCFLCLNTCHIYISPIYKPYSNGSGNGSGNGNGYKQLPLTGLFEQVVALTEPELLARRFKRYIPTIARLQKELHEVSKGV